MCAQRFHTVVYTNEAVFTFGLNAGQLGMFFNCELSKVKMYRSTKKNKLKPNLSHVNNYQ